MKHIKTYKLFESIHKELYKETFYSFPSTKEEVIDICSKYNIINYIINEDFSIDVNDTVYISHCNLEYLPIQFNKVSGNFKCNNNLLKSLYGAPKYIGGFFDCSYNNLTELDYNGIINKSFYAMNNNIVNIKSLPKIENSACLINLSSNKIYSLDSDIYRESNLELLNNPIITLLNLLFTILENDYQILLERIEEFDILDNNDLSDKYCFIDFSKLEQLFDFYDKDYNDKYLRERLNRIGYISRYD